MKQGLSLRFSQHLALTPQLQQSIRLLQLSTLELSQEVEQMLDENPFLEVNEDAAPREEFGLEQTDAPVNQDVREFENAPEFIALSAHETGATASKDAQSTAENMPEKSPEESTEAKLEESWEGDGTVESAPDDGEWGNDAGARKSNIDDSVTVPITFHTSMFQSIAAATAQEVADAITKNLRSLGFAGTAVAKDDGNGPYVQLISDTIGASSSVTVLGGHAQNALLFDAPVSAGGNMSTQWTLSLQPGGVIRYTWSGGANPQLGKLSEGNYVNIYGGGFASSSNEGSHTITKAVGGIASVSYFEIVNPLGTPGIIVQGNDDAVRFYNPVRKVLASRLSYAVVYQPSSRILQVFLPAATKVVRRERVGSAHLHDPADAVSLLPHQEGPYMYDISQPYTVSHIGTTLAQNLDGTMPRVISVVSSAQFPDQQGNLILGYGTSKQEGPIPYIARPSSNTLLISPAYTIKYTHPSGSDVALVAAKAPADISRDGLDYPFYTTDVVSGRVYVQELINSVAATGINIVFTILYPNSIGLGKWGTPYDENPTIWGA